MRSFATALRAMMLSALALAPLPARPATPDEAPLRAAMVATIEAHAAQVSDLLGEEGLSPAVLEVMRRTERHLFVPEPLRHLAYADRPVQIGYGQTISQPFIVALMTHLLAPEPDDVVLEIGTGSGYQAGVLSPLVARVCTIEIIPGLAEAAIARLAELGYRNVETRIGDGYHGWPECGPFDGILVTAAADHVPPPLVQQLKPGGRMVIPVGGPFAVQFLTLVEKNASGEVRSRQLLPVRFVPFTRAGE
ncbi:MAG TPA: protein-L-isoaspartate(D-aspartate) O-methyltransferase [Paracoccaceae bacterium]|nr:protein-L-isoaspartate(D-aspartate) O-methyltransferase [Paracoccaceae bacterium]